METNGMNITASAEAINFQAIFEAMPGSFIVVQPDEPYFTVLAVSNELLQLTSTKRAEVVGKSIFIAYPENPEATLATGPSNLRTSLQNVLRYKQPDQMPVIRYDVKNAMGIFEERYWRASCKPVLNDEGEVAYILITTADVTDVIKAEKAQNSLSELEKINHFFMQAPVAICMVKGPDYIVELANDGMLQFMGRTSCILYKPIIESLPEAKLQGLIAILDHVRKTGETYPVAAFPAVILINGIREQRYFNLLFKPYYESPTDNQVSHIFCAATNVTEEVLAIKEAEQATAALHFRNALFEAQNQATADGVLIVDTNGKILLYNKQFAALWKMPQEILDNKDDAAAVQHSAGIVADPQRFVDSVQNLYSKKTETSREEILFKDGRVIERNSNPIVGEDETFYGWAWYFRDITERIRGAQKLAESESLFRSIVEQAPVAITLTRGEDVVIESINAPMLKIMGKERKEEVLGKKMVEVLPEIAGQQAFQIVKNVLFTGEAFKGDEVRSKILVDGKPRDIYLNLSFTPVMENGKIASVLHVAIDVTDRVLARKRLEESEHRLSSIFEQAPVAISIIRSRKLIIELANPFQLELLGRSANEVIGRTIFEGIPEAEQQGFGEMLTHIMNTGEPFEMTGHPVTINYKGVAQLRYFNLYYHPLRESDGTISGIVTITTEVTDAVLARKAVEESEERARLAVESADLGTYEIDLLTNELFASPRMAVIFGVEQDAHRDRYITALYPEDQKIRKAAYNKAYQTGQLEYEGRVVHKDRSVHWIRIKGKVYFDQQNKPVTIHGVVQDITIEKEIERQKDDFISIVSHELKTPITSLKAYAQILTRKYSLLQDMESTGMLSKMNDQVNRLNYIVQDLLDVSRIEANKILFRMAAFNFSELVAQTVEEVQRTTETHKIIIETNAGVMVHADRERTSQVLINLLTNAIAYSPKGCDIMVATYCNAEETVCSVKDFGSGIEPEKQTRIFERFYRATDVNRYNSGLGLGLYISAEIIKRQNGRIWVESEPGKGATFYFTVPLK